MCNQISDAVLYACLEQDPYSSVACDSATKTDFVILLGEITTRASLNYDELVRRVFLDIGYDNSEKGFDGNTCAVQLALTHQSCDIVLGVDKSLEAKSSEKSEDEIEAIGMTHPLSINVETFGTGKVPNERIASLVKTRFDLRPRAIIRDLGLRHPIFHQVAAYEHFGRTDLGLPWERTDKADSLRQAAGVN
jgi:S-adenosylmethionine synthetase